MDEIIRLTSIRQYCDLFGFEFRHPQVGIVECTEPERLQRYCLNWGFYSLFLKDLANCVITYGKTRYDHGDQTVIAFAPGQVSMFENDTERYPRFTGLLFHPDFIRGTSLGKNIKRYTFFSYESNEALHLTAEEVGILKNLLGIIASELRHDIDRHTQGLVCTNIELLLDYCMRFYDRQFTLRHDMNRDVLARFERMLDEYLASDKAEKEGIPAVNYFADKVCLSPNYFGDLIKKETGKSAKEYIQLKMLDFAKGRLLEEDKSITQIGYSLGFQYPQHFVRFFKNLTGITPSQFRNTGT